MYKRNVYPNQKTENDGTVLRKKIEHIKGKYYFKNEDSSDISKMAEEAVLSSNPPTETSKNKEKLTDSPLT